MTRIALRGALLWLLSTETARSVVSVFAWLARAGVVGEEQISGSAIWLGRVRVGA